MVVYPYDCAECGAFDARHPAGSAPSNPPCPTCDRPAKRRWTAPRLGRPSPASLARGAEERINDRPAVVTAPSSAPRPRLTDPRQARLPRP